MVGRGFKNTVVGVMLFVTSSVLVLGLMEFYFQSHPAVDNSYPNSPGWFKAKWYDVHRNGQVSTTESIDDFHPQYGWILKENLHQHSIQQYQVSINNMRCRVNPFQTQSDSPQLKILSIGDSFTFGECVDDSSTWSARLQELIPNSVVSNIGVHAWGHDQILLRLKDEIEYYKPDFVVLGCVNDDLLRNHFNFRDYAKPYFELEKDSLIIKGVPVATSDDLHSSFRPRLVDFFVSRWAKVFDVVQQQDEDRLSEKILSELVRVIRTAGSKPVFVYMPWKEECMNGQSMPSKLFTSICGAENVLWIDPTAEINKAISSMPNPEKEFDCHYSPSVNRKIAKVISVQINSR
jgi:hypothetical protein